MTTSTDLTMAIELMRALPEWVDPKSEAGKEKDWPQEFDYETLLDEHVAPVLQALGHTLGGLGIPFVFRVEQALSLSGENPESTCISSGMAPEGRSTRALDTMMSIARTTSPVDVLHALMGNL